MRMEGRAAHSSMYPDLREFYTEGLVETGSSVDLPIHSFQRLLSTAPPRAPPTATPTATPTALSHAPPTALSLSHAPPTSSSRLDNDLILDLNIQTPEEPEEDYHTQEMEPDYDTDDEDVSHTLTNLNLNAREQKILNDKKIEVPLCPPRDAKDFRAWMTWRMQANRLLAAVILIRQGHHVHVRQSEIRRKPLTKHNVEMIVKAAKGGVADRRRVSGGTDRAERTSLPECPYIMYGIPRVKLPCAGHR